MSKDISKLKKEAEITLKDGKKAIVRGVYLSTTGLMVVAKTDIAGQCDQNFKWDDVTDVKTKEEKGV